MSTTTFNIPKPYQEPACHYELGTPERALLQEALQEILNHGPYEVPCVVDGVEVKTGNIAQQVLPSDHKHVLSNYHQADAALVEKAIAGALKAKREWEDVPFGQKTSIWLKLATLVSGPWRFKLMAATMLGQGKNAWQAEIDVRQELADFFRFGPDIVKTQYESQPAINDRGHWNRIEWRALEGFVGAVSPFNFTALAGNLVGTPLLVGNVVVWKPSDYSMLASYMVHQLLLEAGVPPSAVQFVPGPPELVVSTMINNKNFAGLHFTGSSDIFKKLNQDIAANLFKYRGFPRIVGETGGKNYIILHKTADIKTTVPQVIRAAFEYAGQKCSALSRLYVSKSLWQAGFKEHLVSEVSKIKVGPETEWENFVNALIHKGSYEKVSSYVKKAKDAGGEVLVGGTGDDSKGYFYQPTVIETKDPKSVTMVEEIFGPVVTVYVYDDEKFEETLTLVDDTSDYGLTGAIFADDRKALVLAEEKLRYSAGNFYLNDKCTAAGVGSQPFGGARNSGTNDKVASPVCFSRFMSPRVIKENFIKSSEWSYPSNIV
ncbi:1-pyrroline-5-carboxylate dehydrogenase [Cryptococcus amylolentus CBS 6273]|uniref:Multifunctional fusion protein n=1 Tax=Cryptococcus amylolentus CBS 6273 TaxID=1296118 RepID=A0A1E3K8S3_9TREE|nr:1-pyrroline-5-carboxylate dehydrogenase [Cryptococcus amylolentus CBS 6273]